MKAKNTDIEIIGNSLLAHVQDAATSRPGIIEELFPHIVEASKKISARAISRFFEEKHNVKISYVTIGRALRNPHKYWNLYYDTVEAQAWIVAEAHNRKIKDFMSEPEKYQAMLEEQPVYPGDKPDDISAAQIAYDKAVADLDKKWFCIGEDILEEARGYILPRLSKKPDADEEDQENDRS